MRTFSCMDCNNQVSRSAYCCPHCGNTRVSEQIKNAEYLSEVAERKKMKKAEQKNIIMGMLMNLEKWRMKLKKKQKKKNGGKKI